MAWIESRSRWLPPGNGSGGRAQAAQGPRPLTVSQFAERIGVSRTTVFKYLDDTGGPPVIPPELWYKLPGGHIRILESAVALVTSG